MRMTRQTATLVPRLSGALFALCAPFAAAAQVTAIDDAPSFLGYDTALSSGGTGQDHSLSAAAAFRPRLRAGSAAMAASGACQYDKCYGASNNAAHTHSVAPTGYTCDAWATVAASISGGTFTDVAGRMTETLRAVYAAADTEAFTSPNAYCRNFYETTADSGGPWCVATADSGGAKSIQSCTPIPNT